MLSNIKNLASTIRNREWLVPRVLLHRFLYVLLLSPFWLFMRRIYRTRLTAFGCFDDCFNIMAGYFMLHGKRLYSEIFFNHQPIPAYLSTAIQQLTDPQSIYLLIYQHRMVVIWWSIGLGSVLVLRFGLVGVLFVVIYESTKGYVFGDRFLAESFIVYPIVYMAATVFQTEQNKYLRTADVLFAAAGAWFTVFSRLPYAPLGLFLYAYILWKYRRGRLWKLSLVLFIAVSLMTVMVHRPDEYFFNVITVTASTVGKEELASTGYFGVGLLRIVASPLYHIWPGGAFTHFRYLTASLSVIFIIMTGLLVWKRRWAEVVLALSILALSGVRPITPGVPYYEAFHGMVWYAVLIILIGMLVIRQDHRLLRTAGIAALLVTAALGIFHPASYLRERIDRQTEFVTNYGQYGATGDTVRIISRPEWQIFLDGHDDLIYWESKRFSGYPYSWYTSVMPAIDRYAHARFEYLRGNSPEVYYSLCSQDGTPQTQHPLPSGFLDAYDRIYFADRPSCLFVRQDAAEEIGDGALTEVNNRYQATIGPRYE